MIKKLLLASLTLFSVIAGAQNILGYYSFGNVNSSTGTLDPTPPPAAQGVSFSPFSAQGVSPNPNASFRFTFTNWPVGATNSVDTYSTFTGVLTPTAYYEVSLTPQAGYSVALSSIVFSMRRSSTGVRNFAVRSSVDSYSTNLAASVNSPSMSVISPDVFFWTFDATSNATDIRGNTITLGGSSFSSFTNSVSFRFYAWNAEGTGGTFSLDSVVFYGSASNTTLSPVSLSKNASAEARVKVSPNPSPDGQFVISNASNFQHLEVFDVLGKIILQKENKMSAPQILIDLGDNPSGSYFVRMTGTSGNQIEKVFLSR